MTEAFPPEERRPQEKQRDFTDHNALFHPHAVVEDGMFAGLLNYWSLGNFIYIEHLATLPSLRGGGLGRRILQKLMEKETLPIVLEVEPPTTDLTRRRIGFYTRCGFTLWDGQDYLQPPYAPHLPAVPLLLMVHGALDETRDFQRICKEIHNHVYSYNTNQA